MDALKYIFFEENITCGDIDDFSLILAIAGNVGKDNLMVTPYPRRKKRPFFSAWYQNLHISRNPVGSVFVEIRFFRQGADDYFFKCDIWIQAVLERADQNIYAA